MKIRLLAILATLSVAPIAAADVESVTLVKATDLSPSNVISPTIANGMMTYRPCVGIGSFDPDQDNYLVRTLCTQEGLDR